MDRFHADDSQLKVWATFKEIEMYAAYSLALKEENDKQNQTANDTGQTF